MIFFKIVMTFQAGRDKLWVVNEAILITINHLHGAFQVWNVDLKLFAVFKSLNEFLGR